MTKPLEDLGGRARVRDQYEPGREKEQAADQLQLQKNLAYLEEQDDPKWIRRWERWAASQLKEGKV